jgi:hypothetical protein
LDDLLSDWVAGYITLDGMGTRIASLAIRAVWLSACGALLWFVLATWSPGPNSDAATLYYWGMLALTFPGGLLVIGLVTSLLVVLTHPPLIPDAAAFVVVWVGLVVVGYWQWFVLMPRVVRRWTRSENAT